MAKTIKLEKLQKDLERWPGSWAGTDSDIPIGKEIVEVMRLFLAAMVADQFAYTTINRHINGLWLLGGEIIYRINMDPELKGLNGKQLIMEFVDEEGGPLSRHLSTEPEQRTFDATCKKFHRFITQGSGPGTKP
jgi:hypothetical protein